MSTWTRPLQTLGPQGFLSHLKPPKPQTINPLGRLARPLSRAVSFIAIPQNFIPLPWFRGLIPFSSSPTPRPSMCKSRRAVMASRPNSRSSSSFPITDSGGYPRTTTSNSPSHSGASVASKTSSSASLVTLCNSLQETPTLYPFSEISAATKNFVASSSSSSRRCSLRGKDAVVFRRPFRGDPAALPARLVALCKSHHSSLVRLLGASLAGGSIYLVYEHSTGAPLADCLRNPRNPNFTPLSSSTSAHVDAKAPKPTPASRQIRPCLLIVAFFQALPIPRHHLRLRSNPPEPSHCCRENISSSRSPSRIIFSTDGSPRRPPPSSNPSHPHRASPPTVHQTRFFA